MDNDLITLTLVRIETKQHIFFLAYKTNSSSPITKNKTKKPNKNKKPTNKQNKQEGPIIQVHGNSQYFKFCPGHICVNQENLLVLWQQGEAETLEPRQAVRKRQEIRETQR